MYQVYKMLVDDTLDSLALKMNIESEELCRLNGMDATDFVPGEFIVLPKNKFYSSYIVKTGDTLFDISGRFNVDLNTLYALNGLDDGDYIYPNQELIIPSANTLFYITREGDTLNNISNNLNISSIDLVDSISDLAFVSDQLITYKRD